MDGDLLAWGGRALIAAVVALFARLRQLEARRAAADVRLDHLERHDTGAITRRLERHDHRLSAAEARIETVPQAREIAGLSKDIGKIAAAVEAARAAIDGQQEMISRLAGDLRGIDEHLRERRP